MAVKGKKVCFHKGDEDMFLYSHVYEPPLHACLPKSENNGPRSAIRAGAAVNKNEL